MRLGYLKPGDQLPRSGTRSPRWPSTRTRCSRHIVSSRSRAWRPDARSGHVHQATLSQATLPELTRLRRSLLAWLNTADTAGLDEDGMVALFTRSCGIFVTAAAAPATVTSLAAKRRRRMNVIESTGLGKRYGSTGRCVSAPWRSQTSRGRAGWTEPAREKTTLLNLTVGLAAQSAGIVTVLGGLPAGSPGALDGIAFVARTRRCTRTCPPPTWCT